MKQTILFLLVSFTTITKAQVKVDVSELPKSVGVQATVHNELLQVLWPIGSKEKGKLVIDLRDTAPLFKSVQVSKSGSFHEVGINLKPVFLLTVGKRDLISQNGWNIFFDKTNKLPHQTYPVKLTKQYAKVSGAGSRILIQIGKVEAASFSGTLEIILYNGSPLFNVAAVMSTNIDSTAILYDAGLSTSTQNWKNIAWTNTDNQPQSTSINYTDTSQNVAVKYRMITGENAQGSLVLFPPPHQYFYPLDEAFNLKFTWYGNAYHQFVPEFGMGIRQDLMGDNRFVPWFNAPPGTQQRLNFFCYLSATTANTAMQAVQQFTHSDTYKPLPGYKTLSSHFHNEYVMNVLLASKETPGTPEFVNVFKATGIDIVHLAEFHYTAHPQGPDEVRLKELKGLFNVCKKYSDNRFLLLPGEEPNEFFGGHWLEFFPKPVYWIMSRKPNVPLLTIDSTYGKVYRIGDKADMLKLLELENGLAWTAHARTKGSTGYPDKYFNEQFYQSNHFLGAAWKALPADLSQPRLGKRVLDLMDDMANKGFRKQVLAEADLFSVTQQNEMYAHLNVNYLQLDKLPAFKDGWQSVLNALRQGKFFVSTGEVLLPYFTVDGKQSGDTIKTKKNENAKVVFQVDWTFPLQFAEIISGDGTNVYRKKIDLRNTLAFGKQKFAFEVDIRNRKWVRVEVWDVAANGAFTQPVWID